jgi:predicted nucleotidyltransferase
VRRLYVFGSAISNKLTDQSDVDLMVEFDDVELENYADNYFDLKFCLQEVLKRPVDLIEEKAIKNPFFKAAVDNQRKLVYAS